MRFYGFELNGKEEVVSSLKHLAKDDRSRKLLIYSTMKISHPSPTTGFKSKKSVDCKDTEVDKKIPGYVTANLLNYRFIKEIREELKENPTDAERLIWEYLRNKKTGYKIRRQHVIDNFIPDFVCLAKKLVIEIDGGIHLQQKEQDALRTNTLNEKGYKVIRFTNEEVFANPAIVVSKIKEILDSRETFVKEE